MLKRIGISVAALCAALALAKPPAAAAADRDDHNNRPSYTQSQGRNTYEGYQSQGRNTYGGYQSQGRYQDDRYGSTWQNSYGYNQRGSTWGDGDGDSDDRRSNQWQVHNRANQRQSWRNTNRDRHEWRER